MAKNDFILNSQTYNFILKMLIACAKPRTNFNYWSDPYENTSGQYDPGCFVKVGVKVC